MTVVVGIVLVAGFQLHRPERPLIDPSQTIEPRPTAPPGTQVRHVYRPTPPPAGFSLVSEQGGAANDVALPGSSGDGPALADQAAVYVLHYERATADPGAAPDTIDVLTIDRGPVDLTLPTTTSSASSASSATGGGGVPASAPASARIEDVTVGNHRAILDTTELDGPVGIVTWDETPEITIKIVASGAIGRDALLAIAETVTAA